MVQEMAIAAGIPAPEVRLLDAQVANAAAVGTDVTASYVVVGRRLLDEFDREETEGLLAHLIGSIGNGDLRGAAQIHSLLYVLELLIVVVLAPFARYPRRVAWRWLTFPLLGSVPVSGGAGRAGAGVDGAPHGAPEALRRGGGGDDPVARARPRLLRPAGRDPRPRLSRRSWRSSPSPRPRRASSSSSPACRWASSGGAAGISRTRRPSSSPGIRPGSTGVSRIWGRPGR